VTGRVLPGPVVGGDNAQCLREASPVHESSFRKRRCNDCTRASPYRGFGLISTVSRVFAVAGPPGTGASPALARAL